MRAPSAKLRNRARELRTNQTDAERKLWRALRGGQLAGAKFRRQQPIGPYIVDFCCWEHRLVIELDGGQHADEVEHDETRTAFLESNGLRVIRFWNNTVLQSFAVVLEVIHDAVSKRREEVH